MKKVTDKAKKSIKALKKKFGPKRTKSRQSKRSKSKDKLKKQLKQRWGKLFNKLSPFFRIAGITTAVLTTIVVLYLTFPVPNLDIQTSNFSLKSEGTVVNLRIFRKEFSLGYHYGPPFVDQKELHFVPQDQEQLGNEYDLENEALIVGQRLTSLEKDLYQIAANIERNEIIVTIPTWLTTEDILLYTSFKGVFSAEITPAMPDFELPIEMQSPEMMQSAGMPVDTGLNNDHIESVTKSYSTSHETIEIKFSDPEEAGLLLPAENLQSAVFKLDGNIIGSMEYRNITEVNGENPVLASLETPWKLKTVKIVPLFIPADQTLAILKHGPLLSSLAPSEETVIPGRIWKPEIMLAIPLAAMLIISIILFLKQPRWIFPAWATIFLATITVSLAIKVMKTGLTPEHFLASTIPTAIYLSLVFSSSRQTAQKIKQKIDVKTAMVSAWADQSKPIILMLAVLSIVGLIEDRLKILGVSSVVYLTAVILTKPLLVKTYLKKDEKENKKAKRK